MAADGRLLVDLHSEHRYPKLAGAAYDPTAPEYALVATPAPPAT